MEPKEKIDTSALFQVGAQPEPESGQQVSEGNEETFDNWNKEKAIEGYRKLQQVTSKHAERAKELEELLRQKEIEARASQMVLEQMKTQTMPKQEIQAPPSKPVKPAKPSNYDRIEALTDPNSVSAKYDMDFQNYLESMSDYQDFVDRRLQTFEKEKQAEYERQSQRNTAIQQLIQSGATEVEAIEIYNRFTASDNPMNDAKKLIEFNRFLKGSGTQAPVNPPKNGVPSPGILPSRGEPATDESKQFLDSFMQRDIKHLFNTK